MIGDFSTACVPHGITTAKVTLSLRIKKPLNKQSYGPSPLVLLLFLQPPCLVVCPIAPHCSLSAGAGLDGHVGVNLEHWVFGFVLVKHSQRIHLVWDAAGLRNARDDPDGSDYTLDGGVVGWPRYL